MTAWIFGDSFEPYAFEGPFWVGTAGLPIGGDAARNYWDGTSGLSNLSILAGRFPNRQSITCGSGLGSLIKTSGLNHPIHHLNLAMMVNTTLSGTNLGIAWEFYDGTTVQCSICFRSDGAIVLYQGVPGSATILATFLNAIPTYGIWYSFEFALVINATSGSFSVYRNGNPNADFTATGLNTAPSGNAQASKIAFGSPAGNPYMYFCDVLWRSDPTTVPWLGDVRCFQRPPASDATVTWSRPSVYATQQFPGFSSTQNFQANWIWFTPMGMAPEGGGLLTGITFYLAVGFTGHLNCAIYETTPTLLPSGVGGSGANSPLGGLPTTLVGAATAAITNPAAGAVTFNFSLSLSPGQMYCAAVASDTTVNGLFYCNNNIFNPYYNQGGYALTGGFTYAQFPMSVASVVGSDYTNTTFLMNWNITPSNNSAPAGPWREWGGIGGYVYTSTVGDADLYNIGGLTNTSAPVKSTVAVTMRALMQYTDYNTVRSAEVNAVSGTTSYNTGSVALSNAFEYYWRTDQVDPNTSAAWTTAAVSALKVGVSCLA